jgi:hypothetical protein
VVAYASARPGPSQSYSPRFYVVTADIVAAALYDGYSRTSQMVSELFAYGAPSRIALLALGFVYNFLLIAFGIGVLESADGRRALRAAGWLLMVYGALGFTGPFVSMDPVSDTGGPMSLNDIVHATVTGLLVLVIVAVIVVASTAFGTRFRIYSGATLVTMVVAGVLVGIQISQFAAGEPTPVMGIIERINIGAFLLWVAVLAAALWLRRAHPQIAATAEWAVGPCWLASVRSMIGVDAREHRDRARPCRLAPGPHREDDDAPLDSAPTSRRADRP